MTPDSEQVYRVCVVCAGNICRSPMGEAVLRHRLVQAGLDDHIAVESAGTAGWHVGDPADPRALRILAENGYDADAHIARQLPADWPDHLDLVLAVDRDSLTAVTKTAPDEQTRSRVQLFRSYDTDTPAGRDLDIPDPYFGTEEDFIEVLRLLERASDGLLDIIRTELAAGT